MQTGFLVLIAFQNAVRIIHNGITFQQHFPDDLRYYK